MRAGRRDRRVMIQTRTDTRAPSGEPIEGWADVGEVWAGKRDVRAGQRFGAAQIMAEVDTIFEMVRRPGGVELTPDTHRLVFGGRVYRIHGVAEIGRNKSIEVAASARAEGTQ